MVEKRIFSWGHSRRFNAYSNYFKTQFGSRIQKVSIDAGFSCPNRNGLKGRGGCTYCNNSSFNPSYCEPCIPVAEQVQLGIDFHQVRYKKAEKYLAYFQAYTNTFKPIEELKEIYEQALSVSGVIGMVVGTRPDCVNDELLDYFAELSRKVYLKVEYGIESIHNRTLKLVNRGHTYEESVKAIEKTAARKIRTGAHYIIGLPGESDEEILMSADVLSELPLTTVKFHQLQIIKGTKMAEQYQKGMQFRLFDIDEYLNLMMRYIERLNPEFMIERISAEAPPRFLVANIWGLRTDVILNKFEKLLEQNDTWQGKHYKPVLHYEI